jgi:hypothetical protein
MVPTSDSTKRKPSKAELARLLVARGRRRFLVVHSLLGSIVLWLTANAAFAIRGIFRGINGAYLVFAEMGVLLLAFPFALAIGWHQWRKFQKLASDGALSIGGPGTPRFQNDMEE